MPLFPNAGGADFFGAFSTGGIANGMKAIGGDNASWGDVSTAILSGNPFNLATLMANNEQIKAAERARQMGIDEARRQEAEQNAAASGARDIIAGQGLAGAGEMQGYNQLATDAIREGQTGSLAALEGAQTRGVGALNGQNELSLAELYGGAGAAAGAIGAGAGSASRSLARGLAGYEGAVGEGTSNATGELDRGLADSRLAGLASSAFTPSADYAYRKAQGQRQIMNAASASGSRHGGNTLAALQDFGQGLASQEYNNWADEQQQIASGLDAQEMSAATQGANLLANAGNSIAAQRMTTAGQGADLASNTGTQIGNLAYDAGSTAGGLASTNAGRLSSFYQGLGGQMAGTNVQAGQQTAGIQGAEGMALADLYAANAAGQANVLTGKEAQNANLARAALPSYQLPVQYAGQTLASMGNTMSNTGQNAALLAAYMNNNGGGLSSYYPQTIRV